MPPIDTTQLNFTLDSDAHSLTFDISINGTYYVQVAAYNRQGIGPFSAKKQLKVRYFVDKMTLIFKIMNIINLKYESQIWRW